MAGVLTIRVGHADSEGDLEAVVYPPDIMRWEAKSRKTMADLNRSPAMSDLAYLAWAALTREELVRAPFDTWSDGLTSVMPVNEEPAHPTDGAN